MDQVNKVIISAVDNVDINSAAIDASDLYAASFQAYFTGSSNAVGTFKIQASNDPHSGVGNDGFTPTHWVDIPSATAAVSAGEAKLILLSNLSYRWIRAVWDWTSGGGQTIVVQFKAFSL